MSSSLCPQYPSPTIEIVGPYRGDFDPVCWSLFPGGIRFAYAFLETVEPHTHKNEAYFVLDAVTRGDIDAEFANIAINYVLADR